MVVAFPNSGKDVIIMAAVNALEIEDKKLLRDLELI